MFDILKDLNFFAVCIYRVLLSQASLYVCTITCDDLIQLLPLSEGDMTVCSPEAGNIARGRSPRAI